MKTLSYEIAEAVVDIESTKLRQLTPLWGDLAQGDGPEVGDTVAQTLLHTTQTPPLVGAEHEVEGETAALPAGTSEDGPSADQCIATEEDADRCLLTRGEPLRAFWHVLLGVLQDGCSLSLFLPQASFSPDSCRLSARRLPDSVCHQCLPATLTKEVTRCGLCAWRYFPLAPVGPAHCLLTSRTADTGPDAIRITPLCR